MSSDAVICVLHAVSCKNIQIWNCENLVTSSLTLLHKEIKFFPVMEVKFNFDFISHQHTIGNILQKFKQLL